MTRSAKNRVHVRVHPSLVRVGAAVSVTAATAVAGSLGCGGRTTLGLADELTLTGDGGMGKAFTPGSPGPADASPTAARAEDASPTAPVDAGDAAACAAPGLYLVTSPSAPSADPGPYSLALFDPTSSVVKPLGSMAIPLPTGETVSILVTRSGQIIVSGGDAVFRLDTSLAPTSPPYLWPESTDGGKPISTARGVLHMAVLGLEDGGERFVGLGAPIGFAEFDFDASTPLGDGGLWWSLAASGAVWPSGPLGTEDVPLAGTGDGRLFALSPEYGTPTWFPSISQIDPVTGEAIAQVDVPVTQDDVGVSSVNPFAFWAGDFYTFQTGAVTDIVRLHPGSTTRETVAQVSGWVVAATSSPCAPTQ